MDQTQQTHTWKAFQASLKPEASGDRHPFFPLRDVVSGQTVNLTVLGGPYFDGFHGQYSLVELDVSYKGQPYRLCVSGARLARALAAIEPGPGAKLAITAKGDGKARDWTVTA